MEDTVLFDFVFSNNKLSTSQFSKLLPGKANIFNLWNLLFRFWSPIHREMAALSGKNTTLIFSTTFLGPTQEFLEIEIKGAPHHPCDGRLSLNRDYYSLLGDWHQMITWLQSWIGGSYQVCLRARAWIMRKNIKIQIHIDSRYTIKAMYNFLPWYESKLVAVANLKSNSILSWR